MHAFALLLGTILAHPWAASVVARAQKIVTYFKASHKPQALLRKAAKEADVKIGLRTSNKTRFTSVEMMLTSVKANERALKTVLRSNASAIASEPVKAIIRSDIFWPELDDLLSIIEPVSQVIMAIQSTKSTLADVMRYSLYLAGQFQDRLPLITSRGALV